MKSNRKNNPKFQNNYVEPPEIAEIFDEPDKYSRINNFFTGVMEPFLNTIKIIPKFKLNNSEQKNDRSKLL